MPLWGHRRGTQSASGDLITRIHATSLDTSAGLPRIFDVSNPSLDADSSSSDEDLRPAARQYQNNKRPTHTRSMSHPFPNPLAGVSSSNNSAPSKRGRRGPNDASSYGYERNDDHGTNGMQRTNVAVQRKGPAMGPKDMTAGNCMTCGGTMRWPQDLKVFKCTICATINDLVTPAAPGGSSASPCLKLDHTKRLIRQSIRSHLCRRLLPDQLLASGNDAQASSQPKPSSRSPQGAFECSIARSPAWQDNLAGPLHLDEDEEPARRLRPVHPDVRQQRRGSNPQIDRPTLRPPPPDGPSRPGQVHRSRSHDEDTKRIFSSLELYIASCFNSFDCISSAFPSRRTQQAPKSTKEPIRRKPVPTHDSPTQSQLPRSGGRGLSGNEALLPELDPKLLLLGDVGENGMWWTGPPTETKPARSNVPGVANSHSTQVSHGYSHSPQIHWDELAKWYHAVMNAAEDWFTVYEEISQEPTFQNPSELDLRKLENELLHAQEHVQRHLMKATEMLLKRPGRPLTNPSDVRFLLIILENPYLHSRAQFFSGLLQGERDAYTDQREQNGQHSQAPSGPLSGQHSGLIKRILGLLSNASTECHDALITWLSRTHTNRFARNKDLVSAFLTYRMLRTNTKKQEGQVDITAGLIPQMQTGRSGAYLHDEIGGSRAVKRKNEKTEKKSYYSDDWQVKAAARVLGLFFAANNLPHTKRSDESLVSSKGDLHTVHGRDAIHANGQLLPTSDFYLSIIDYSADLVADFEAWEAKRSKFTFCQYPFLLSIRSKTEILEHDAQRQMQTKARDAFFDSIMSRRAVNQYFSLDVRRDCLVDDSLKAVSEVIGSGSEDIKKALRISFHGEEGIDGGGLRKEWFLMLIREVFNPDHGLFLYDDESQFCYFNPNSFETTDQFFLVGVVIGLAIYNSTILDVALPPFAFRKLLASAPAHGMGPSAHPRPAMKYTLEDLGAYRPRLARGLRQLLDYDGDVEAFGLDFAIDVDKYGTTMHVPLCRGGENKAVTNANRREYVDLYVLYLLDTSVKRQFEPFKRGFYTVCGGNAFSLFRPEEIELLVRGSDQPLDIPSLRAVATYDNWGVPRPNETEPVVDWFWNTFERAPTTEQRRLLSFITGSDRIPATGASTLSIRIACLGDETDRFPIARTCFNSLSLFKYPTREKLEAMLWRAVHESEGFGLK